MRGQLIVGNTIVREIRPMDVIRTCDRLMVSMNNTDSVTNEQWSKALFTDADLIEGEINEEVNKVFAFINRDYLKGDTDNSHVSPKKDLSFAKLKKLHDALLKECAVLVSYNYQDCWTFGWSFFQTVQSLYREK